MAHTCIEGETITDIDYSGQSVADMEYDNCTFKNCNFANASLTGSRFYETAFVDCNLSNADLSGVSLQDVTFTDCIMPGLHFDKCNTFGFAVSFRNCQLNHSVFYKMQLGKTSFAGSQLQRVDFTEATLKNVSLQHCDLLNAVFENTNLEKADLTNAKNYSIDPEINKIKGAKFSLPDVVGLLTVYEIEII